ncbi:hypothetical protein C0992_002291 [Termitomyces sp. T32_za158]|nr:hypothetical protein C0992_002291 [Termitomyces sp. T32_za158]
MIVIDGNNTLKRIKGIGQRQVADSRRFQASDYFLPSDFVDRYAGEVKAHSPAMPAPAPTSTPMPDNDNILEGDPTDGDVFSMELSGCTDNWKAAASNENKKCGQSSQSLRFLRARVGMDMIASSELAKYPLAVMAKALEVFKQFLLGYDIGCTFAITIKNSSLGPDFRNNGCCCCVNAFHGYSHNYLCQLRNHPNAIEGVGLEDLETLKHVFSSSNVLGAVTCYMSAYRRQIFIDLHFQHWDHEKYANLANMLYQNYRQALKIIENNTLDVQHVLKIRGLDEVILEGYIMDEQQFFMMMGKQTDGDLHAIAYVELLQKLWSIESQLDDVSARFLLQTPKDYQFIASEHSYAANLSETRKTDTACRQLIDEQESHVLGILELEPKYIANHKYEMALDNLKTLVIKQLFELHKLNLSQMGYRM